MRPAPTLENLENRSHVDVYTGQVFMQVVISIPKSIVMLGHTPAELLQRANTTTQRYKYPSYAHTYINIRAHAHTCRRGWEKYIRLEGDYSEGETK